ncbi:molybdopterin-dependent oxidoreductase [Bradyrhizobium sp. dw_78]|uniref:molybdopterin-containing oxidoreductase family protein n=1 Tax=Bradyrhizobium sp. dw_78 TaxID=2719793 RepID=UPI00201C1D96|nr:molybdopterin-dependent oxidoreductase [Bradyrhizobium sp. dw_78]
MRALPEWTYHPDRLTHPLRRVGERGSGQWERISWDQALDEIADKMAAIRERYGAPALVGAVSGAAFSRGPVMALLMRSIGSPNWMINQDLCGGCRAVSDRLTGLSMTNGEDIDNAACILVVGRNPMAADPVQWLAIKRAKARGASLIVIDPFRTSAADIADLWLQPLPGTDAAIAMAMMRQLIAKGRHDAAFVQQWCTGFDALAERVAGYTPERAAKLTGVAAADIVKAADLYAAGPSVFVSGHGIDAASNGVQTFRAFHCLVAISGNLDRPGGNRRAKRPAGYTTYMDLLHDPRFRLPAEIEQQTIGAAQYPLWAGPAGWQTACHNKSVLDAILDSTPYPVRGMYVSGVNIAVMYPDTRRTLAALKALDFLCVAAHTMTPTAAVADIVLPKTTTLEEEEVDISQTGPCVTYTAPASKRIGEVRCDIEIAAGIMSRMRARGALTAELLPWPDQASFNRFLLGEAKIDREAMRRDGFAEFSYELRDFAANGFKTPSGKIELYSNTLAGLGLDPLPDHVPPLFERATKLVSADFPLVLQTGQREKTYHHSRFREQAWARKVSPDPTIRIHPETAGRLGLADDSWVIVETEAGAAPCRLRAEITDRTAPDIVTTGIGWWRPEADGPEFDVLDINVNAALTYAGPMDPMSGSVDTRALPCRLRPA